MPRYEPRFRGLDADEMVPMQWGAHPRRSRIRADIARLVYEEYANQGHGAQSFERLHERGGFGAGEMIMLLADLVCRERNRRSS